MGGVSLTAADHRSALPVVDDGAFRGTLLAKDLEPAARGNVRDAVAADLVRTSGGKGTGAAS